MAGATQLNPGRNLSATIKQGFDLMRGRDVPSYSLYFLNPTKKHQAGDYKSYVVEHLKIGRGADCDIRYGDDFSTVSRHHASIAIVEKDFILRHNPKASNPTLVNNREVREHKLQNGEEIQLSQGGPKIRFNTSTMKTSTMGFTSRMALWGKQALRPYRYAVAVLALLLVASLGLAAWQFQKTGDRLAQQQEEVDKVGEKVDQTEKTVASMESSMTEIENRYEDRIKLIQDRVRRTAASNQQQRRALLAQIEQLKNERNEAIENLGVGGSADPMPNQSSIVNNGLSDNEVASTMPSSGIYIIRAKNIEIPMNEDINVRGIEISGDDFQLKESTLWTGTGFLTQDGQFITARHVVQPWRYPQSVAGKEVFQKMNLLESHLGLTVDVAFEAEDQQGNTFTFKYSDFRLGDSQDRRHPFPEDAEPENQASLKLADLNDTDWAYMNVARKGKVSFDRELPGKLQPGDKLYSWGYPRGEKLQSGSTPTPSFGTMSVSKVVEGDNLIYTGNRSFTNGNSGGPVFAMIGDSPVVVGIVSAGWDNQGIIVPISQIH